ncbi:alpha/beta hydrolase [uncultured Gilvimarinus sp.]|uniref:alpha/beta hydrolase n=1 Tax=uncultured Gilvimarinus sp. TaxID=1689143 RepID=UPI0030EEE2B4
MNILKPKMLSSFCLVALFFCVSSYSETWKDVPYLDGDTKNVGAYLVERAKLDIYCPDNVENAPVIVWFHGGGLRSGEKELPERLLHHDVCVVAPNYRLFPTVKSPTYIDDAARAVDWVYRNIKKYGGDKDKMVLSGHSAGGYLALMTVMDKRWLAKYKMDANKIARLVPFSGHTITHFTVREERGVKGEQPIVDDLAPLFHVRADAPPITLITGDRELELLGRYEENAYFARMQKVNGHKNTRIYEMDGYGHNMVEPALPILLGIAQEL